MWFSSCSLGKLHYYCFTLPLIWNFTYRYARANIQICWGNRLVTEAPDSFPVWSMETMRFWTCSLEAASSPTVRLRSQRYVFQWRSEKPLPYVQVQPNHIACKRSTNGFGVFRPDRILGVVLGTLQLSRGSLHRNQELAPAGPRRCVTVRVFSMASDLELIFSPRLCDVAS